MPGLLLALLSNLPTIFAAAGEVSKIISVGTPIINAWEQVSPEIVPLIKQLAGTVFGSAGDFEHGVIGALLAGHPLTQEQENRLADRMSGVDPVTGEPVSGG